MQSLWVHGALLIEMEDNQIANLGSGRLFSIIAFLYAFLFAARDSTT